MKDKNIKRKPDKKTNINVFDSNSTIFKSIKCFGNLIVQYNICKTGNIKLARNTNEQNIIAIKDL